MSDEIRLMQRTWQSCRLTRTTFLFLVFAGVLNGQSTSISITGPTYNQDFNTLPTNGSPTFTNPGPFDVPTSTAGVALRGWAFQIFSGTQNTIQFRGNNGGNNNQAAYSYGTNGQTDRALGSLAGPLVTPSFGALFVNNTGSTLNSITITYTGEQWRQGNNPNTLAFQYAVGATSIASSGFTNFSALNFTGPQSGPAIRLDGNSPANRVLISATITGLNWTAGSRLVIRWNDNNDTGANAGLAIDNFSLAIPEPATVAAGIAALGLMALAFRARSNRRTLPAGSAP